MNRSILLSTGNLNILTANLFVSLCVRIHEMFQLVTSALENSHVCNQVHGGHCAYVLHYSMLTYPDIKHIVFYLMYLLRQIYL